MRQRRRRSTSTLLCSSMEQADDCETMSSVFGMRRPLEPYRFQRTFSKHRGSQKEEHENMSGHSSQRLPFGRKSSSPSPETATSIHASRCEREEAGGEVQRNSASDSVTSTVVSSRAGHTRWCSCGHCFAMDRDIDSTCCGEYPAALQKRGARECITAHPGFREVCLSEDVLRTALVAYEEFRRSVLQRDNRQVQLRIQSTFSRIGLSCFFCVNSIECVCVCVCVIPK